MAHPPSSYLTPDALDGVLELARALRTAAEDVGILSFGSASAGAGAGAGRAGDAALAMQHWIGPHRGTFERLHAAERTAAEVTRDLLEHEADDWARFWAEATAARRQREYEESLADYRLAVADHQRAEAVQHQTMGVDPATSYRATRDQPIAPGPPPPVAIPTAAGDYRAGT